MNKKTSLERWTIENAVDLYGVHNWGAGYFDISENGSIWFGCSDGRLFRYNGYVSVEDDELDNINSKSCLSQNYPNPFIESSIIRFQLSANPLSGGDTGVGYSPFEGRAVKF